MNSEREKELYSSNNQAEKREERRQKLTKCQSMSFA
jgi:hypothetical protein